MTPPARPLPETSVLSAHDPELTNSDDWDEFRLIDATVTLPGSKTHASLLLASDTYPLTLSGKLETPLPKETAHILRLPQSRQKSNIKIEIDEVRSFAYGVYEDGSIGLWAAGKAGWFVVQPSKAYKAVYREMVDAVNVLFFITDAYKPPKKATKSKNAKAAPDHTAAELFEKYAREQLQDEDDVEGAKEALYMHKEFLLSSMILGKEGLAWSKNPFYTHLCRKFPEETARVRRRLAGTLKKDKPKPNSPPGDHRPSNPAPATRHSRQESLDSVSSTNSLKRKRGRPPKNGSIDVISIASSSINSTSAPASKADSTKSKTQFTKPKTRATRQNPAQETESATPEIQESQPETPAVQDSDSESARQARRKHKRKSSLRLKPSKPSKGLPKKAKAPPEEDAEDVEDDDDELSLNHTSRDDPGIMTGNGKRKREQYPSQETRKPKKRSSRQQVDEGIDMPSSPSASEGALPAVSTPSDTAAGADPPTSELAVRLHHSIDQLQEDVWTCALDGCTHKVYAASRPDSQSLIREHYALHAYDDDERVQLVKSQAAPSLPVGHLMERIRMQARVEGFPGSRVAGTRFPEPLRQRF